MSRSFIRILIVEDTPSWQNSLRQMYERVLGDYGEVACCSDPEEAILRLRRREYDLLSLDIALGDRTEVGSDGLDVFDKVVEASPPLVSGVIVISGARFDKQLKRAIPDGGRRAIVEIELQPYLEQWYPGRVRMFEKHPGSSRKEIIARVEAALPGIVSALGAPPEAYAFDDKAETVTRLLDRSVYNVSQNTYKLLKALYIAQAQSGGPLSNRELYESIFPNRGSDDADLIRGHITDCFRHKDENTRAKKDLVVRAKGFISLRIP